MFKKSAENTIVPVRGPLRYKTAKLFAAGLGLAGLSCIGLGAANMWLDYRHETSAATAAYDLQNEAILRLTGKVMLDPAISSSIIILEAGPPDPATAFGNWATSARYLCASRFNQLACERANIFKTAEELDEAGMFAARDTIDRDISPWETLNTSLTYTGLGLMIGSTLVYGSAVIRQEQAGQV